MFLCCGDALFDLFTDPPGSPGSISLNGHVGGSPLNVATGLARMGNATGYLCKNSTDIFGQRIEKYLASNNIALDWVIRTDQNSTLAVVETDETGSANYVFYTDNTADVSLQTSELPASLPADILALHIGSYSTGVDPTASSLLSLVQREQTNRFVSYDPNIRPTIEPDIDIWRERFNALAPCCDFIKASDEDIATLFGTKHSFENFASDTLSRGPELVIITKGGDGATAYNAHGKTASIRGKPVDVVDTVGAGDTFQASTLHWLQAQKLIHNGSLTSDKFSLDDMLDFAASAAAVTCTRRGADLPTLDEINQYIQSQA